MKKSVLIVTFLGVAITLMAASCANKPKAAAPAAEATEVAVDGELAPDFELPNLQGSTTKLSSLRGKYVVLDFWGSWCVWCIRGIPKMKEAYTKYKDKMEILGVDCRDTEESGELPLMSISCLGCRCVVLMSSCRLSLRSIASKVSPQRLSSILMVNL